MSNTQTDTAYMFKEHSRGASITTLHSSSVSLKLMLSFFSDRVYAKDFRSKATLPRVVSIHFRYVLVL